MMMTQNYSDSEIHFQTIDNNTACQNTIVHTAWHIVTLLAKLATYRQ